MMSLQGRRREEIMRKQNKCSGQTPTSPGEPGTGPAPLLPLLSLSCRFRFVVVVGLLLFVCLFETGSHYLALLA